MDGMIFIKQPFIDLHKNIPNNLHCVSGNKNFIPVSCSGSSGPGQPRPGSGDTTESRFSFENLHEQVIITSTFLKTLKWCKGLIYSQLCRRLNLHAQVIITMTLPLLTPTMVHSVNFEDS